MFPLLYLHAFIKQMTISMADDWSFPFNSLSKVAAPFMRSRYICVTLVFELIWTDRKKINALVMHW